MLAAEVLPIKGNPAKVPPLIDVGVQEASDPLMTFIDKAEEFTVIDGFIELRALEGRHLESVSVRVVAECSEALRPSA